VTSSSAGEVVALLKEAVGVITISVRRERR